MPSDWPLLTGGRYSEVVVRTGLTLYSNLMLKCAIFLSVCSNFQAGNHLTYFTQVQSFSILIVSYSYGWSTGAK
jgi:hypothetical protein